MRSTMSRALVVVALCCLVAFIVAISGCPNSCSQPQLAQVGVVCATLARVDDGGREPRYDLWRRDGDGFGTRTIQGASREELFAAVAELG